MKFWKLFILFSFLSTCTKNQDRSTELTNLLQIIGIGDPVFLFSFPGRDVPEESKLKVKKTILQLIADTKNEINGYVYGLNDLDLLIALRTAKLRGVKITLRGDKDENYSEAESFGLTIERWRGSGIHHLKVLLFDQKKMFLGTGNFTSGGLVRDNNVFWQENLTQEVYQQILTILNEEEDLGILNLANRKMFFSPEAGYLIQDSIIEAVRSAKQNIRYMIYTHYDPFLSYELVAACNRGIRVEGIYNDPVNPEGEILASSFSYPCKAYADGNVDTVYNNGSYSGGLLHHKTLIIDDHKVLVGSYNFTVSARDENREFYTEFEDPSNVREFIGEWNRVKSLAHEISNHETTDAYDQKLFSFKSSILSPGLLLDKTSGKPFYNKNSGGLAKELNQSLGFIESLSANQLEGFNKTRNSIQEIPLPESFDWLHFPFLPMSSFSVFMIWDKIQIQLPSSLEIKGIYVWDGKKIPIYYPSQSGNIFPVTLMDLLRKEQWLIFKTAKGNIPACTKKKDSSLSKWILYLIQKQLLNGSERTDCQNF